MKTHAKIFLFALIILSFVFSFVTATVNSNSPSACSGQWTSCSNAFADNTNRATATATGSSNKTGIWNNYGFSIKDSAIINSVVVRADFFASKTTGFINVKVSGNGGATYGPAHKVGGNTAEQSFIIDVTSDVAWTGSKLNNSNFVVNVTCFKNGGGSNPTCNLDWVPVNVTYTPFDFSVSTSPTAATVAQARSAQTTVTVTLLVGNSQNVALSQSSCPPSATCSFNVTSGNPTFKANFTVATSAATPAGVYSVNLTGSGDGLSRIAIFNVNVTDSTPVASASANPTSGYLPLTVSFTGSVVGGDAPITYLWNFSDGLTSTLQSPQHTFTTAGNYNVSFTATDFDGDSSSSSVLIVVGDFSVSTNPSSDSVAQARSVSTTVTVTLLSGNSQTVSLSQSGCPPSATCSFNVVAGNPTFYSNLTVATGASTPVGTYVININATNGSNVRQTSYTLNVTDSQPVATASATPTSGNAPLAVNFTGSVVGGDAPLTYFWDFNDGTNSTSQNPQHTYSAAGIYNATFKATDFDGDSSVSSVIINVSNPPPPSFDFSVVITPTGANISKGTSAASFVTVTLLSGASQTVTLSQSGCPLFAECLFNVTSDNPTFTSNFTVTNTTSTPLGNYTINITGRNDSLIRTAMFTLNVTT